MVYVRNDIHLTVAVLGQLHGDRRTYRGAEHPFQHLDNFVSDLNSSSYLYLFPFSTSYFFRRRELWIGFVDPFIVSDHRPETYVDPINITFIFSPANDEQKESHSCIFVPPGVVIIKDGPRGGEQEDRLQG